MIKKRTMNYYALNSEMAEKFAKEDLILEGKTDIYVDSCVQTKHGFEVESEYREGQIPLNDFENTHNRVTEYHKELAILSTQQAEYINKLSEIEKNCSHQIGVLLKEEDILEDEIGKLQCLLCGSMYGKTPLPSVFDHVIDMTKAHLEGVETDEEKMQVAYEMYISVRAENPELTDEEVVAMINNQLNSNRNKELQKTLENDNQ